MAIQPIPEGYHTVTPYLIFGDAAKAIEFYTEAFGATEVMRILKPDGGVGHAEIRIGDSMIMLADEHPDMGASGPEAYGGSPASFMIYVEGVDERFSQALAAGAEEIRPVKDQFYGDRSGTVKDPFGYQWSLATHVEDVSPEEMDRRHRALAEEGTGA